MLGRAWGRPAKASPALRAAGVLSQSWAPAGGVPMSKLACLQVRRFIIKGKIQEHARVLGKLEKVLASLKRSRNGKKMALSSGRPVQKNVTVVPSHN